MEGTYIFLFFSGNSLPCFYMFFPGCKLSFIGFSCHHLGWFLMPSFGWWFFLISWFITWYLVQFVLLWYGWPKVDFGAIDWNILLSFYRALVHSCPLVCCQFYASIFCHFPVIYCLFFLVAAVLHSLCQIIFQERTWTSRLEHAMHVWLAYGWSAGARGRFLLPSTGSRPFIRCAENKVTDKNYPC